jgi:enamine deaminase RidA (YjgF/YER057c/UK114 family)
MKTDLRKVLSISGQPGLYMYISQATQGAIVEALATKKRTCCPMSARMTSLADIAIYTDEEEVRLQAVLEKMHAHLGESDAPSAKSKPEELKALFEAVLPDYDRDRFYVSHMKKVVEWYNLLKNNASLDFEDLDAEEEVEETQE